MYAPSTEAQGNTCLKSCAIMQDDPLRLCSRCSLERVEDRLRAVTQDLLRLHLDPQLRTQIQSDARIYPVSDRPAWAPPDR